MNLTNISAIISNKTKAFITLESNNLFCWLVSFFILGLFIATKVLESNNFTVSKLQLLLTLLILFFLILLLVLSKFTKIKWLIILILITIFAIFGFFLLSYKAFNNKTIFLNHDLKFANLSGKVDKIISYSNSRFQTIYLKNVVITNYKGIDSPNNLKLTTYYKYYNLSKGDTIKVWAHLKPIYQLNPFENGLQTNAFWQQFGATGFIISKINIINTKNNLKSKGILQDYINNITNYFLNKITKNFSYNTFGIAQAVTLGTYVNINKQDRENLINSGLSPFIAISGLHIAIIAGFIFIIVRVSLALIPKITLIINTKKVAAIVTIVVLCCYLLLLQNVPSAFRAGVMSILFMIGLICNIRTISIRNLLFAGFILLLFNPEYISSASFLLSFIATGAIIALFNNKRIKNIVISNKHSFLHKIINFIIITSLLSIVVTIALFPIIVYLFGKVPLYGIFANLIVTPLFSLVIMPFLFTGLILPETLSYPLFKIAEIGITLMLKTADLFGNMQFSTMYFAGLPNILLISYIMLFLIFICSTSKLKYLALILCFPIFLYIFLKPYPNIMIDKQMNQIAFLNKDGNKYIFNTLKGGSFIRKVWVRDNGHISNKNLKNSKVYYCDKKGNCLIKEDSFVVSFNNDVSYLKEACSIANLIIIKGISNIKCSHSLIIDKLFLQKYGSSFIYFIKPHTIKVVGAKGSIKFNAKK